MNPKKNPPTKPITPSKKVSVTVVLTGEILELPVGTGEEVSASYDRATHYLSAYRQLQRLVLEAGINILKVKS